jgi:hypothetical protein
MTANCAKPGERRWVAAQHGYNSTMRRQVRKQSFDMGTRVHNPVYLARCAADRVQEISLRRSVRFKAIVIREAQERFIGENE